MASIIPGYKYDIFISYRQNDNRYDGWVTEFVDNLNKELEANIKERISVYFDINPKDGLLETHSVDRSVEEKLDCLIFIPILSRTYCDPKSFAWQHEFCAFNILAKKDMFGRDIRLSSGNVASRILPVKIHDLDPEDQTLLEKELGGVLRCVEFIYKSAGVNRPLSASEDHPHDNLNKTYYRDQINKVAIAVKEIITALKNQSRHREENLQADFENKPVYRKNNGSKLITGTLIMLVLIIAGYFIFHNLIIPSRQLEKSIAVLPFKNDTPDANDENIPFINGLMEEILINLQTIKEFRVPGRTSVEKYRDNSTKTISEIARELGVNYIVEGSGQKYGNILRLRIQLIRAKGKEAHIWANSYEQEIVATKDIFDIQTQIAQSIAQELKAVITPREKQIIEKRPTENLASYDAYLKGLFFYDKNEEVGNGKAIYWFKEAINLDSAFALPWTYLSMCYWRNANTAGTSEFSEAKQAAERALQLDPSSGIAIVNVAEILDNEYNFQKAEEMIKQALIIDPDNQYVLRNAGRFYTKLGKVNESTNYCTMALRDDPNNRAALYYLAMAYYYAEQFSESWATLNKYQELEYKGLEYLYYQLLLATGDFDKILTNPGFEIDINARNVALAASCFSRGDKVKGEEICDSLKSRNIAEYWIALAYAYGDESTQAVECLEKSFARKEKELTYLIAEPAFKKIRNNPGFTGILNKMKFPVTVDR